MMNMLIHSDMSDSLRSHGLYPVRLLCPWGFSRQEYWSGRSLPSPGDLPNPGVEPGSPALQTDSLLFEPTREVHIINFIKYFVFRGQFLSNPRTGSLASYWSKSFSCRKTGPFRYQLVSTAQTPHPWPQHLIFIGHGICS